MSDNKTKTKTGGQDWPGLKRSDVLKRMELRDWFAGRALTGIIAHPEGKGGHWTVAADDAYKAADAMIARRSKK